MRTLSLIHRILLAGVIITPGLTAVPAFGQDAGKVRELQRVIEAQQKQLEVQQKQLDEQRQLLQDLQTQIESLADDTGRKETKAAAGKPQTPEKEPVTQGVAAATAPPPDKETILSARTGRSIKAP